MIGYEKQVYITEKLLFRFLMAHPLPIYKKDQEKLWSQYQKGYNAYPARQIRKTTP